MAQKMYPDVIPEDFNETGRKNDNVETNCNKKQLERCPKNKSTMFSSLIWHGQLISFFSRSKCESDDSMNEHAIEQNGAQIKVYRRRFWVLFLNTVVSMLNALASIQYSAITNITVCYYGVTISDVNWMSTVYFIVTLAAMFPEAWFLERYGLRGTTIVGSFLTSLGVVVQCASLTPDGFTAGLIGQVIGAIGQSFIINVPPRLATKWFAPSEVSTATSVGVFGNQLGSALGFIFPSYVIPNDCLRKDLIRNGKETMTYSLVVVNVCILLLIILTFENKPRLPPSPAEAYKLEKTDFKMTVLTLVKNRDFVLHSIAYGLITDLLFSFTIILNQLFYPLFPTQEEEIGLTGFYLNAAGLFGIILLGYILDRTHKFKETSMVILGCSFLSMCAFTGLLHVKQIWVQYVTTIILGFFVSSYLTIGFDLASEITYPAPEGTAAGIMLVLQQVFGTIMTAVGSKLIVNYGNLSCNLFFCAIALVAFILTGLVKCECRRLNKNMENIDSTKENCCTKTSKSLS